MPKPRPQLGLGGDQRDVTIGSARQRERIARGAVDLDQPPGEDESACLTLR